MLLPTRGLASNESRFWGNAMIVSRWGDAIVMAFLGFSKELKLRYDIRTASLDFRSACACCTATAAANQYRCECPRHD
jgi:predicted amidohydrolase